MTLTRPALVALVLGALYLARSPDAPAHPSEEATWSHMARMQRARSWRPVAVGLAVLALADVARLWTPRWPALDAGLVAAWPGVVAVMAWAVWGGRKDEGPGSLRAPRAPSRSVVGEENLLHDQRDGKMKDFAGGRQQASALIALAYLLAGALVAALYRHPYASAYVWELRASRLAAVALAVAALRRAPRATAPGVVVALLVVEQAVQLVGAWRDPWAAWWLARWVTLASYGAVAVVMGWAGRRV